MQSIIQILKVNPVREGRGKESGREYRLQDAECLILDDSGQVEHVGVLLLPRDLTSDREGDRIKPGHYIGTFGLRVDRERRISGTLVGLQPYTVKAPAPKGA